MPATFKIFLRESVPAAGGRHPVYLRLTIDRVSKFYSLRVYLSPGEWQNLQTQKNLATARALVAKFETKAAEIIARGRLLGFPVTFAKFEKDLFEEKRTGNNFIEFVAAEIKLRGSSWSPETVRMKKSQLEKLKEFAPGLLCDEIDLDFCQRYVTFLRFTRMNNSNTVNMAVKTLRLFINWAVLKEVMATNEAKKLRFSSAYSSRVSLDASELMHMVHKYEAGEITGHLTEVCRAFLFACFTGLRFTDLRNLTVKNLEGEILVLHQQKTGRPVRIPLHHKALKLLGARPALGRLFNIPVNQVYNRQIKEVMAAVEIKKSVSSHTARHTFACVGLELGISLKSISDMLGHNSIRTTEIYARMNDTLRKSEAAKFNSL